eukprot:906707-Pyramimonas_sp.AAC.1
MGTTSNSKRCPKPTTAVVGHSTCLSQMDHARGDNDNASCPTRATKAVGLRPHSFRPRSDRVQLLRIT